MNIGEKKEVIELIRNSALSPGEIESLTQKIFSVPLDDNDNEIIQELLTNKIQSLSNILNNYF